ncbi:MAG TPA: hypothetical protein DCQ78_01020 [Ruminococcus sp.]|nr:hypothetical protein [Ruminococcus sp.]
MSKKKKTVIAVIIAVILTIILVIGAVLFFGSSDDNKKVPPIDVSSLHVEEPESQTESESVLPENWDTLFEYSPSPSGITQKTKNLYHINPDIAGWLKIDGTYVNYPFVIEPSNEETQAEPNTYYLHRGLDGEYLYEGTLYMDYRNILGSDEESQSENIVIYGHNMLNDTMFGSLHYYRRDHSFYADNPIIQLSSDYRDYQYVIFGFIITSGSFGDTDFHYWNMEELDTEDDFNYYVDRIKQNSLVDTGVDVKYGDKLLTLSTCYSDADNSRFIVVARRLRKGETSMENIGRTEAYIEEHRQEPETKTN